MEAEIQLAVKEVWTQFKIDERSQGKVHSDQIHFFINQVSLQIGIKLKVKEQQIQEICANNKKVLYKNGGFDQQMIAKIIKSLLMQTASDNVFHADETDDLVEVQGRVHERKKIASQQQYKKDSSNQQNKVEPANFSLGEESPQFQSLNKKKIDLSGHHHEKDKEKVTVPVINILNEFKNSKGKIQNLDVELSTIIKNNGKEEPTLDEQKSGKAQTTDDREKDAREDYKLDSDDDQDYRRENDPTQFWSNGKWHTYSKKSIFLLNYNNKYRLRIIKIITNKRFDHIIVLLIMINSLLLGIKDYTDDANCSAINSFVEQTEPVFMWSFLIECILKVLGMGFILDQGSYLRDAWNWLDFIVVVSSLLTEIPSMRSVSGMRTFRLLRPLRTLTTMPSMKILISTLIDSVAQLGGVLVLAVFFFIIFAILGVSLWKGSVNKRCRLTEFPIDGDWDVDGEDPLLCSNQRQCSVNRWCGSLAEANRSEDPRYELNSTLIQSIYRDSEIEDLNFGFTNFDNLAVAFLTIFQCITLEGWINVCNMFEDAYDIWFVDLYFLLLIIVCSMFVLNLTIAVMLLKYEEFDKSEKGQSHDVELQEYGQKIGLPLRLVEFLIEQDNLFISKKGLATIKKEKQVSLWKQLIKSDVTYDAEDKYYNNKFTQIIFLIVNSPIFNGFIIFVIMMNTITLSLDQHPKLDQETLEVFGNLNVFFSIIFTVECVLKVIGLGVRDFVQDRFNLFDAAIVLVSILEFIIQADGEKGGAFSALRAFRLFRILKIFRAGQLRTLLDCITFTLLSIKDYLILLILFIYVLALLGMSFFAGKVTFDGDNQYKQIPRRQSCDVDPVDAKEVAESPRANFDTLMWAYLTVFEIMIGENWNGVMYDHMRSVGQQSCLFFVALVICGNIIMLNLFLAILLGNFDRARAVGEKKKLFAAFETMEKQGLNLKEAILCMFDDADFAKYIEDKILMSREDSVILDENNYTELEILQVTQAIKNKKVKELLTGELELDDFELEKNLAETITEAQKEKSQQIITEIKKFKRQNTEKQEYIQKEGGRRQSDKALDRKIGKIEKEIKSPQREEEQDIKVAVKDSAVTNSTKNKKVEYNVEYFRNSSLLIFHQDSFIRKCCQLCVQSDKEQNSEQMNEQQQADQNGKSVDKAGEEISSPTMKEPKRKTQIGAEDFDNSFVVKQEQYSAQKSVDRFNLSKMNHSTRPRNIVAKLFEGIILTLIIISSVSLIIDNPLQNPEADHIVFVGYMDNCFTMLFTMECIIKIVAMGFIMNNQAMRDRGFAPYITNPWNMLDFVVVVASLIDFSVTISASKQLPEDAESSNSNSNASSLQSIKALRALRALRPLRMISRNKGMKLIVNALLASIPNMTNVAIVCALFLLIFAIMGVDQFKGRFWRCSIEDPDILELIITKEDCLANDGEWINTTENFDNTALGTRTLFEMMSTEGWIDVMNNGIDAVGVDMQPKKDHNTYMILYFTIFMMFGSQFILNLFVGIIMDNFNRIKDREEWGGLFVTEDQRTWIDAQRLGIVAQLTKRVEPPKGIRGKFYLFVNHPLFDGVITLIIILNTAIMATRYDGMSPVIEDLFGKLNTFFTVVFNIEMILKLIGLDKQYFYSSWNLFDMIVVICTNIGLVMDMLNLGKGFSTAGIIIRAFRIMRIIRLVRKQPDVKIILDTLVNILPQITNFIALMFLLLFIYAALGINLFGGVVQQEFITPKNNFSSIGVAIMFLFRSSTGEDWNKIMHELAITNDDSDICIEDQTYEVILGNNGKVRACGLSFMAQVYMLSFTFVVSWLIMNLSVAAVIEGLENAKQLNSGVITKDDQINLIEAWQEYDPKATGWISVQNFVFLLIEQPPPFGRPELTLKCKLPGKRFIEAKTRIYNEHSYLVNEKKQIIIKKQQILAHLSKMGLKQYVNCEGKLHFKEVYQTFVQEIFKEQMTDFEISKYLETKMDNEWLHKFKFLKNMPACNYMAHENYASNIITFYGRNLKIWRKQQRQLDLLRNQRHSDHHTHHKDEHHQEHDQPCHGHNSSSEFVDDQSDGRAINRNQKELSSIKDHQAKKFKIGFSYTVSNRESAKTNTKFDHGSQYASMKSKREQETLRLPAGGQGERFIVGNPYPNAPLTAMGGPKRLPPLKLNSNLSKDKRKQFKRVQSLQTSNKDGTSEHIMDEQDSLYFNTKHGSIQSRMPTAKDQQKEQIMNSVAITQNQHFQKSFEDSRVNLISPFESIKSQKVNGKSGKKNRKTSTPQSQYYSQQK